MDHGLKKFVVKMMDSLVNKSTKILLTFFFLSFAIAAAYFDASLKYLRNDMEGMTRLYMELNKNLESLRETLDGNDRQQRNVERAISEIRAQSEQTIEQLGKLDETAYKMEFNQPKPSVKWMDLQNWRRIKRGMSALRVTKLLGEPSRRDSNSGSIKFTYIGHGKTAYVTFGQLGAHGWKEPRQALE
ncbi:hypothetical protein OAL10_10125 [Gammaproteobacteria bacterium]|nr:hypothetical protein [Gammaproteobacteria bacterium]